MIPIPKYDIGDKVFAPRYALVQKAVQCPECLGEKVWQVRTPTGDEFELPCGGCGGYNDENSGTIKELSFNSYVEELTIGSVRLDTADTRDGNHPVSYMCCETGIGTGSIYYEHRLFTDREGAEFMAKLEGKRAYDAMKTRQDADNAKTLKRAQRKPTLAKRQIRELKKEVKALRAEIKELK